MAQLALRRTGEGKQRETGQIQIFFPEIDDVSSKVSFLGKYENSHPKKVLRHWGCEVHASGRALRVGSLEASSILHIHPAWVTYERPALFTPVLIKASDLTTQPTATLTYDLNLCVNRFYLRAGFSASRLWGKKIMLSVVHFWSQ